MIWINLDPQQPVTLEVAPLYVLILGPLVLVALWRHQAELGQTRHWRRWARTLTRLQAGLAPAALGATVLAPPFWPLGSGPFSAG